MVLSHTIPSFTVPDAVYQQVSPSLQPEHLHGQRLYGILLQIQELNTAASQMFQRLGRDFSSVTERCASLRTRVDALSARVQPAVETLRSCNDPQQFYAQQATVAAYTRARAVYPERLLSTEAPQFVRAAYESTPQLPLLTKLDAYGSGPSCVRAYSDPRYFVEEWSASMAANAQLARQEKREKKEKKKALKGAQVTASVQALKVKTYSTQGKEFDNDPNSSAATSRPLPRAPSTDLRSSPLAANSALSPRRNQQIASPRAAALAPSEISTDKSQSSTSSTSSSNSSDGGAASDNGDYNDDEVQTISLAALVSAKEASQPVTPEQTQPRPVFHPPVSSFAIPQNESSPLRISVGPPPPPPPAMETPVSSSFAPLPPPLPSNKQQATPPPVPAPTLANSSSAPPTAPPRPRTPLSVQTASSSFAVPSAPSVEAITPPPRPPAFVVVPEAPPAPSLQQFSPPPAPDFDGPPPAPSFDGPPPAPDFDGPPPAPDFDGGIPAPPPPPSFKRTAAASSPPPPPDTRDALLDAIRTGPQLRKAVVAPPAAPAAGRGGLLGEIKNRNFQLRSVDREKAAEEKKAAPVASKDGLSSIMDVLARRTAIIGDDSESDSDSDDWDT